MGTLAVRRKRLIRTACGMLPLRKGMIFKHSEHLFSNDGPLRTTGAAHKSPSSLLIHAEFSVSLGGDNIENNYMSGELKNFIEDVAALVSPPEVWVRLNEVVNDPHSSASDVAEITARDPALAARILKIVNSPYYNFPSKVDTISRAVTILGTSDLFALATAVSAARVFANIPSTLVKPENFWRHSICTGLAARKLAKRCGVLRGERLYVAGLLHDIGSLILYRKFPNKVSAVLLASAGDEEVLARVEQEMFGFDHAELGGALLELWNLPVSLLSAVRYHHDPEQATDSRLEAALVHIGSVAANRMERATFMEAAPRPDSEVDPIVWQIVDLDRGVIDEIARHLDDELEQAVASFMPCAKNS